MPSSVFRPFWAFSAAPRARTGVQRRGALVRHAAHLGRYRGPIEAWHLRRGHAVPARRYVHRRGDHAGGRPSRQRLCSPRERRDEAQAVVTGAATWQAGIIVPIYLAVGVFATPLLAVFGPDYTPGVDCAHRPRVRHGHREPLRAGRLRGADERPEPPEPAATRGRARREPRRQPDAGPTLRAHRGRRGLGRDPVVGYGLPVLQARRTPRHHDVVDTSSCRSSSRAMRTMGVLDGAGTDRDRRTHCRRGGRRHLGWRRIHRVRARSSGRSECRASAHERAPRSSAINLDDSETADPRRLLGHSVAAGGSDRGQRRWSGRRRRGRTSD